jgi:hypothetical protein
VGAAAMLSKALRKEANKGVAGIYELPTPKEPLPDFMKAAQRGVAQQESAQRNMYPNNFADDEGGILMLPRNLRTAPGVPETSLAYITDEEKAILGLLKPGTPHKGPEDVPSYDSLDYVAAPSTSEPDGAKQSSFDAVSQGGGTQQQQDFVEQFQQSDAGKKIEDQLKMEAEQQGPSASIEQAIQDTGARTRIRDKDDKSEGNLTKLAEDWQPFAEEDKNNQNKSLLEKQIEAEKKLIAEGKGDKERLKNLQERLDKTNKLLNEKPNLLEGLLDDTKELSEDVKKKLKALGIIGPEIKAIEDLPEETQKEMFKLLDAYEKQNISFKDAMSPIATTIRSMGQGLEREYADGTMGDTLQGLTKKLRALDTGDGASVLSSLEKFMPEVYFDIRGGPATAGQDVDFAMNELAVKDEEGNYTIGGRAVDKDLARRYNNEIFNARGRAMERQSRADDRNRVGDGISGGRPAVIEESESETIVDADDRTMPYKGPRTGGKEVDVPLSQRFKTDPTKDVAQFTTTPRTQEDIYKYMTQGTTGEGITLEPFSEYQRRRRKALGSDPLGLYG